MGLPTRNLDDRRFQDIVDEARKRIVASCPEWTDHNLSDPGITLVELFAWMTETILYRLNQVPEKHYIKLMELMGLKLRGPEPARTGVTFYLSAPQDQVIIIPRGTEVATRRTETQPAIIFSTDEDLHIQPPELTALVTREMLDSSRRKPKYSAHDVKNLGRARFEFAAFGSRPSIGNALYFGFENDLSHHVVEVELTCRTDEKGSIGTDPDNPPWKWEGFHSRQQRWMPAIVESDSTGGMNESGVIRLRLPRLEQREVERRLAYWVRCRVTEPEVKGQDYKTSPLISDIVASSWGGTVQATHASVIELENLGRSDGSPGQVFYLEHKPLLQRVRGTETIEIREPGKETWEKWEEVQDFADSGAHDKHFTCDSITGEIRFGPALLEPVREIRLDPALPEGDRDAQPVQEHTRTKQIVRPFGAIPPRGAQIRFSTYRHGGGVDGNVRAHTLIQPKTSIPYVERVTNHDNATGGKNAETIEMAQLRAPQLLRLRGRAVTSEDYEELAKQADSRVKRARCIQTRDGGRVHLLLVPQVERPERYIAPPELAIGDDLREAVQRYLDNYRLLTVQLDIQRMTEFYAWVVVDITVIASAHADPGRVKREVKQALDRYLNPIVGGPAGEGWPFGRDLYPSDVGRAVLSVEGVEGIESLQLYRWDPSSRKEEEVEGVLRMPVDHGLIASAEHRVVARHKR
jgi:predicted phage baseplate assembly protein